ncbi:hypothetical protein BDV41DRAFT_526212 [Aspergillus transmontanensis]|uniref:Uncharacterized protein n=1 Tax=Aspergillus transmontanensis TaxID=1034304 RepID=A0A5N6W8Q5_9EURO|nr:hypothetical protein BDV41DRAFT_526212 [Aspergillus transmontanensis]
MCNKLIGCYAMDALFFVVFSRYVRMISRSRGLRASIHFLLCPRFPLRPIFLKNTVVSTLPDPWLFANVRLSLQAEAIYLDLTYLGY